MSLPLAKETAHMLKFIQRKVKSKPLDPKIRLGALMSDSPALLGKIPSKDQSLDKIPTARLSEATKLDKFITLPDQTTKCNYLSTQLFKLAQTSFTHCPAKFPWIFLWIR